MKRPRLSQEVKEVIFELADQRHGAADVIRELEKKFPELEVDPRTVQRYVKRRRVAPGEQWSVGDADPEEALLVLPVIGALIAGTGGRVKSVTKAEAVWIARIQRLVPDLLESPRTDGPLSILLLAIDYASRAEPTSDLDFVLALTPWRSAEHFDRYQDLITSGSIPRARHGRLLLTEEEIEARLAGGTEDGKAS